MSAKPMVDLSGHTTAAFLPFRVEGLISPANRTRIAAVATVLPAGASTFFGYECRLSEPDASADFLVCISAEGGGRENWLPGLPPAGLESDPAWKKLADFVRSWADPASAFHGQVDNMWVEFDLASSWAPLPSVFFGSSKLTRDQAEPSAHVWLIDAIEHFMGERTSAGRRRTIAACLAALPAKGKLFQVGTMLSRCDKPLRLCFKGVAAAEIPAFLRAIGWPGDEPGLRALIGETAPLVDEILIDLDVDDAVQAKIGLECYINADASMTARVTAFLQHLQSRGLCTETKGGALLAWYGLTHELWCKDRWPHDLRDHPARPSAQHSGGFARTLHHIKLVFDPPQPLKAKAYLASRFAWIDDVKLKKALNEERRAGV